ncbi:MAG: hypothetical protein NTX01_07495 [Candidatus Omnitrophica bacterium]|nr:hypothetical protein [Candidatus Omnitrophota bacterium]
MPNKKIIILIILGIAAVISLFFGIFAPGKARRKIISELAGSLQEITVLTRNAKKTAYSSWSRDPFLASSAPIKGYGGLVLSGITWDKENPMAVISDNIVKIGDKVSANTVVDIKQDKVILNDGAKDFELRLGQ